MRHRYSIKVSGKADPRLVLWLDAVIGLLRAIPGGWRATVQLEREESPDRVQDS